MKLTKLNNTEQGFIQNTRFKTLAKLDYDFIRQNNFEKVRCYDATFFDCVIFDENENEYLIRCLEKNNNFYTTRENLKLIRKSYIWFNH